MSRKDAGNALLRLQGQLHPKAGGTTLLADAVWRKEKGHEVDRISKAGN